MSNYSTAPDAIWATPTRLTYENPNWEMGEYYTEYGAAGLGVKYVRHDSVTERIARGMSLAKFDTEEHWRAFWQQAMALNA